MNKKGLEFSIGFVVMLILAVLVFSLSIYYMFKWFGSAEELSAEIDKRTQEQIITALRSGNQLVSVPFAVQEVKRGNKANFGIGVRNIAAEGQFRIDSRFSGTAIDQAGKTIPVDETYINNYWLGTFGEGIPFRLQRSEDQVIPVQIKADVNTASGTPTKKGDYIFDVCVFKLAGTPPPCTLAAYNANPEKFYTQKMQQVTLRVI